MNKVDLIKAIANESDLNAKECGIFLESFQKVVTQTLVKGDPVVLVGFGSFEVVERKARPGRDFATGKMINVPASKTVRFKVGKTLKDSVK